jgi:hypothetical protein
VGKEINKKFYFAFSANFLLWAYVILSPLSENKIRISAGVHFAQYDSTMFAECPPKYKERQVGEEINKNFILHFQLIFFFWAYVILVSSIRKYN